MKDVFETWHQFSISKGTVCLLLLLPLQVFAQLAVTDTMSNQALVGGLGGYGVTISNVSVDCPPGPGGAAYGYFDASNANLNLSEGLLMTTGAITDVIGPNDTGQVTKQNGTPGDPDLDQIVAPESTNDACVVEFDLEPNGDSISFNYSFGSDEYPEWVCSQFNDVFAFFITGPDPNGGNYNKKNIALIPDTTLPVAINSVNNGQVGQFGSSSNCTSLDFTQYYTDNCSCSGGMSPSSPFNTDPYYIQYDGFTNGLVATEDVVPCETYHLKLAVADVSDELLDSGVFVEAESIVSQSVDVEASILGGAGFQNAVEGCVDGLFTFTMDQASTDTNVVDFNIGGTATNGTDYATIPDSVVFPPGDTVHEIQIDAFADGITEPFESVELYLLSQCTNQPYDTAKIFIQDTVGVSTGKPDSLTICRGESIQFDASGGISYNWTPPDWLSSTTGEDPVATPDSSITYVVSSQIGSCVASDSTHIQVAPPGHSIDLPPDTSICPGQSAQLDPNVQPPGSYSYSWSPPNGLSDTSIANPIASPNNSTTYYVEVADSNCGLTDTIDVNVGAPNINAFADEDSICVGGTVQLSVSVNPSTSNVNYSWSPASSLDSANIQSPVATVSNTTDYVVNVSVGNCSKSDTVTVTTTSSVNLTTEAKNITCNGGQTGAAWVTVTGGSTPYSYEWNTGATSDTIANISNGTYVVTATDDKGCKKIDSVSVSQPPPLVIDSTTTNGPSCYDDSTGSASVTASGGNGPPFFYNWSSGDTTSFISSLPAGSYEVTITDTNSCSIVTTVSVNQPSPLQLSTSTTPLSCSNSADGSATVNASGGVSPYSYQWNDTASQSSSTAEGLAAGNYNVTVTDKNGCTATANAFVDKPNPIAFDQLYVVDASCPGAQDGAVFVNANGGTSPYTYKLGDEQTSTDGTFNGLKGDQSYNITILDDEGCILDTSVRVSQPPEVVVDFEKDLLTVEIGQGQRLNPILVPSDTGGYSYMWEPATGLSCIDCKQPVANPYEEINYQLTVFDQNGCEYSETVLVDVTNSEILYIPNAFTPDGDDQNDEFKIYGKGINKVHLQIFNRWGELVFETRDPSEGWDGTYKGDDAQTGVYLYNANVQYIDGTTKQKQGSVTLIR